MAGAHLLLYDGVCGLCHRTVRFTLKRDRRQSFHFAPLQGATAREVLDRFGEDAEDLDTVFVVADWMSPGERLLRRSRAVLFILKEAGGGWRWLRVFGILPTFLLDAVYDLVARSRYRVFGRLEACPPPPREHAARFLDGGPEAREVPEQG